MGRFQAIRKKKESRKIAKERMHILYSLAEECALAGNQERARRYVLLLRRIGMRYNVVVPSKLKVSMCRKCGMFLLHGKTARIGLTQGRLRVECLSCGNTRRFPYKQKRGI